MYFRDRLLSGSKTAGATKYVHLPSLSWSHSSKMMKTLLILTRHELHMQSGPWKVIAFVMPGLKKTTRKWVSISLYLINMVKRAVEMERCVSQWTCHLNILYSLELCLWLLWHTDANFWFWRWLHTWCFSTCMFCCKSFFWWHASF